MKKTLKKLVVILLILVLLTAVLSACKKDTPQDKGFVIISFVTNCEIIIAPIVLDGGDANMPDDPIRAGYTFGGWYYDQLFTAEFSIADGFTVDTTLYAKWDKKIIPNDNVENKPTENIDELGFEYNLLSNGNYEVTAYKGSQAKITIPDFYKRQSIQHIAQDAFANNKALQEISFGWEISSIGEGAFRGCSNLKTISPREGNNKFIAEQGVLYNKDKIEIVVFCANNGVEDYQIGKNIVAIKKYAFSKVEANISFAPSGKYTIIDGYAFADFGGTLTIDNNISEIRKDSFFDASGQILFGDNCKVDTLTNGAFAQYKGQKLVVPSSIKEISLQPFTGSSAIIDLSKSGITQLGDQAFANYGGQTLVIPLAVDSLGKNCFYQCNATIRFESNSMLREIGEQSFHSFFGTVYFDTDITHIKEHAFYAASSQAVINFADKKSDINIDNNAFIYSKASVNYL